MVEFIYKAVSLGATLYASVSGGKDGQAMVKALIDNGFKIEGLVHADLGKVEWKESLPQCQKLSEWHDIPLHVVTRKDGMGLFEYWRRRMLILKGSGKPFWSSSTNRYCTSDLKRAPINAFFTSTKRNLIISCEGIRADESAARSKKSPLSVRSNSSTYYKEWIIVTDKKGNPKRKLVAKDIDWCLTNFRPDKKLFLTWFPVFNFDLEDVWGTYGMSNELLRQARHSYKLQKVVPLWWTFHPAYVYGNERVSCALCILGSPNDLKNGAKYHPELLRDMISLEEEGEATFKNNWSLKELL